MPLHTHTNCLYLAISYVEVSQLPQYHLQGSLMPDLPWRPPEKLTPNTAWSDSRRTREALSAPAFIHRDNLCPGPLLLQLPPLHPLPHILQGMESKLAARAELCQFSLTTRVRRLWEKGRT